MTPRLPLRLCLLLPLLLLAACAGRRGWLFHQSHAQYVHRKYARLREMATQDAP